jgi:hypothetical protein
LQAFIGNQSRSRSQQKSREARATPKHPGIS